MARKPTDPHVETILKTLRERYGKDHPKARIEAYRYNPASIRIRIIDPFFEGKDLVKREDFVWPILESLPEEIFTEITVLLLIPPGERKESFMSMEFENPTPSMLETD